MDPLAGKFYRERLGLGNGCVLVVSNDRDFVLLCGPDDLLLHNATKPAEAYFVRPGDVLEEVARTLGAAVVRVALRAHRLLVVRMLFFAGNTDYVPRLPNADPLLKVSARLAAVAAGLRVDNATEFAVCCDAVIAYLDGTATEDDMRVVEGVMGRMGAHANRTRASLRGFTQHPVRKRRTHARVAAPCAYCARPPR